MGRETTARQSGTGVGTHHDPISHQVEVGDLGHTVKP